MEKTEFPRISRKPRDRFSKTIEGIFMSPLLQSKIVTFIRTDESEDAALAYTIIFEEGRCLCFRFYWNSKNDKQSYVDHSFLRYKICLSSSSTSRHLQRLIEGIIDQHLAGCLREKACIERISTIVESLLKVDAGSPFKKIFRASVQEDFYKGIDAWVVYENQTIPIQIKSNLKDAEKVASMPVLVFERQSAHTDADMMDRLLKTIQPWLERHPVI